jgi:hypothetical protein
VTSGNRPIKTMQTKVRRRRNATDGQEGSDPRRTAASGTSARARLSGVRGVEDIAIELDQDGEWFIALTASGGTATEDAQRAAAAVRNDLGDWYTIQTD